MNKIIIITGDLAAGKTTYSRLISKIFNIACYNKDSIKEILGDEIGFKNREENKRLSTATFKLMAKIF